MALAGEKLWRLPMEDNYLEILKSPIADLKNTGIATRFGGAITASLFLREFVNTEKVRIAPTATVALLRCALRAVSRCGLSDSSADVNETHLMGPPSPTRCSSARYCVVAWCLVRHMAWGWQCSHVEGVCGCAGGVGAPGHCRPCME